MLDSQSDRWWHIYRFKRWANLYHRARRGAPDGRSAELKVFNTQSLKMVARALAGDKAQAIMLPIPR